jgi:hypothetical protein
MSRQNKVNPMQYQLAGRLTPDDAARERVKQRHVSHDATEPRPATAGMPARSATTREKHAAAPAETIARARTRTAGRSRG